MAQPVFPGRYTADPGRESVTLFLIGMRANRWWKVAKVAQVAAAMPRILRHLAADPASGMLGVEQWFGRTTLLVSYWESPEHLRKFAADRNSPHLEPWRRFMKEHSGTGTWESGTKRTRCPLPESRRSTAACRCSGWPRPRTRSP
jgi:Domain of unknown function (DUF4188)